MPKIEAQVLDAFQGGKRRLLLTTAAGTIPVQLKDGMRVLPYPAGAVMLAADDDRCIVDPLGPAGAQVLAEAVLDGDKHALTAPTTILALACAVLAFINVGDCDKQAAEIANG